MILSKTLLEELQQYIEFHKKSAESVVHELRLSAPLCHSEMVLEESTGLEDYIKKNRKPSFREILFQLIDTKGMVDSEVYKKAEIDRRHFSKIRSNGNYRPNKYTVIALALALELNHEDTNKLLSAAGYSLSESDTFDLIIQFCIEKKIHSLIEVNRALVYFSLKPLGGA